MGAVLEVVGNNNSSNEWTIGHFASETTMQQVAASVVSKINDRAPLAPSLNDHHMLLNAINFALLACTTVTDLSPPWVSFALLA